MFRKDVLILETPTRGEWCEPGAVLDGFLVTRIRAADASRLLTGEMYPAWLIYGKPVTTSSR
jgi:hypothetical protein